ncbi:MAG: hypothetical protein ACP5KD_02590 [Fervidobacterium sp.]
MKKAWVISFLVLSITLALSFEFSMLGGLEVGGKNRPFIGARIGTLSGGISLMVEAYYPLPSFEHLQNLNIEEIQFVELDPYLYLAIPLGPTLIYAGASPIVIFDISNTQFSLYSEDLFHLKVGLRSGVGIVFFVEGMTTMTFSFRSLGVYAISAGIGIGF